MRSSISALSSESDVDDEIMSKSSITETLCVAAEVSGGYQVYLSLLYLHLQMRQERLIVENWSHEFQSRSSRIGMQKVQTLGSPILHSKWEIQSMFDWRHFVS
mmetsp:Transcript_18426/g.26470  ORF Transcript_18426/g.26470 Transcript_18426/m.26470 type:complete len:103 (+) Transcript_18426:386-694(+)